MADETINLLMLVEAKDAVSAVFQRIASGANNMSGALKDSARAASTGMNELSDASIALEAAQQRAALASTTHKKSLQDLALAQNQLAGASASVAQQVEGASERQAAAIGKVKNATNDVIDATNAAEVANTHLSKAQNDMAASAENVSSKSHVSATALAGVGVAAGVTTGAIIAFAASSVESATAFQRAMEVSVTQAGLTQKAADDMATRLITLGPEVGQSSEAMANAFYHVASVATAMKLTTTQQFELIKIAAEGAAVGHADLTVTTNALISTVTSGIPGVKNYTDAMGTLNAIVGAGNVTMADFTQSLSSGTLGTAAVYGVDIASLGAAFADLTHQGVPADQAMTRLKMTLALLGSPTKQSRAILLDLGVTQDEITTKTQAMSDALKASGVTYSELAADMKKPDGIAVALQDLKDHLTAAGVSADQQAAIITRAFGGGKMGGTILQLYNNLALLPNIYKQITDGGDKFGSAWAATQETAAFQATKLKESFDAIKTSIGLALLPIVQKLMDLILKIVTPITTWITKHRELAAIILVVVAAIGALISITFLLAAAVVAFETAGAPVLLIILGIEAAVAAVVAVIVLAIKYHKEIGAVISQVWAAVTHAVDNVKNAFDDFWRALEHAFDNVKHAFDNVIHAFDNVRDAWETSWGDATRTVAAAWAAIRTAWDETGGKAVTAIYGAWHNVNQAWDDEWNTIKPKLQQIWSDLVTIWNDTGGRTAHMIAVAFDYLAEHWGAIWGTTTGIVSTSWSLLQSVWDNTGGRVVTLIGNVWFVVAALWTGVWATIQAGFSAFWSVLTEVATAALSVISTVIGTAWNIIGNLFKVFWDATVLVVQVAWEGIKTVINVALDIITGIFNFFKDLFEGNWGKLWGDVLALVASIWNDISGLLHTVTNDLITFLSGVWDAIRSMASAAWNAILAVLQSIWTLLQGVATTIFNALVAFLSITWDTIKSTASAAWNAISTLVTGVWTGLKDSATTIFNAIVAVLAKVWSDIKTAATSAWTGIVSAVKTAWDGLKKVVAEPLNIVIGFVNGFVGGAAKVLDVVGVHALDAVSIKPITLATGGVLPGYSPGIDSVPAMLSPGEGILTPQTVRALGGAPAIHALNRAAFSSGGLAAQHFDTGGVVSGGTTGGVFHGSWKDNVDGNTYQDTDPSGGHFVDAQTLTQYVNGTNSPAKGSALDLGGVASAALAPLKSAWDATKSFVKGMLIAAATAALVPLEAPIKAMPDSPLFSQVAKNTALKIPDGILAWIKKWDDDHGSDPVVLGMGSGVLATPAQEAAALSYAIKTFSGLPYTWGDNDCSGIVRKSYGAIGYGLPGVSSTQWLASSTVPSEASALPGDLAFYNPGTAGAPAGLPGHVGFWVSPGKIFDAYNTSKPIGYDPLMLPGQQFMGLRRPGSAGTGGTVFPAGTSISGLESMAAAALGIPMDVVAKQIFLESSNQPNKTSATGAQGLAQFEPGTWAQFGNGDPMNPVNAMDAYVKYMRYLLGIEGGDIRKALEAYNAGPGNLAAGAGYANAILGGTSSGLVKAASQGGVIGSALNGTMDTGPNAGLWWLHPREMVIPAGPAHHIRSGHHNTPPNIVFSITGNHLLSDQAMDDFIVKLEQKFVQTTLNQAGVQVRM